MLRRLIGLGIFAAIALSGCKPKKAAFKATVEREAVVSAEDVQKLPEEESPPIADETAPKQEEPVLPPEIPSPQLPAPPMESPCDGVKLVFATDQLGTTPLKAQIDFNGKVLEFAFTPKPKSSMLCLRDLPESTDALLTLRILQDDVLRFIAKRAHTEYKPFLTTRIVIDNCLIQRVPWEGRTHDGGCEWTITEVGP